MPKRGIKKRILNKVSTLFSIRGNKHRLEIHGEPKELDCNLPKEPDKNRMSGVLSSMTPQKKPRGIRFSRRAVQRSKYLRQKFGVRKTVMGFSPRVGSIIEEDESEITLWMLAENAENVISEGMAWLRNSEDCCEDSTGMEQEDHEKILQMWIESNSFDKLNDNKQDDKGIYNKDDYDSSSFSEDDDDDNNDGDDNSDDDNDDDITQDIDINSYPAYDTATDSDDEDAVLDDDGDTVDNNEITDDSVNEKCCSIYVDDESFDELDDDDDNIDDEFDDQNVSHEQLESSGTHQNEFAADKTKEYEDFFDNVKSKDGNNDTNCEKENEKISWRVDEAVGGDGNHLESQFNHGDKDSEDRVATLHVNVLDSRQDSDDYDHDHDGDDYNGDINHNNDTSALDVRFFSKDNDQQIMTNTAKVDLNLDMKLHNEQTVLQEKLLDKERRRNIGQDKIAPDEAVISTVKGEIDEILSRISQIESDFNFMRKSMNEFRSSDEQNDSMQ